MYTNGFPQYEKNYPLWEEWERTGIYMSSWPAIVTKLAKVCKCLNRSHTVNKAIFLSVYPIPALKENLHHFQNAKLFSTFDR